jgi:uncharacterized protein (TIGR00297 family)
MHRDGWILISLGAWVLALALAMEMSFRRRLLPQWLARKLLHIGAVGACALAPLLLERLELLGGVVAAAEGLLLWLVSRRMLFVEESGRRSWGIALFPLAYLLLLALFPQQRWLIAMPMAVLALSDASAALVGKTLALRHYSLTGDPKSLPGSLAFGLTTLLLLCAGWQAGLMPPDWDAAPASTLLFLLLASLLLTLLEALGSKGFDNVWVPLGAAALLSLASGQMLPLGEVLAGLLACAASLAFSWLTIRRGSLSADGAALASLMGIWVVLFAGASWLLPLFFFFASSTLLGRLNKRSAAADEKQGKPRDAWQVICNGAPYALAAMGMPAGWAWQAMGVAMAAATADTWASEIGMHFRGRTYDLLRGQRAQPGLSGAVSLQGTLGGLAGAFSLALLMMALLPEARSFFFLLFLGLAGFAGMLLDSLLGSALQARFRDPASGVLSDTGLPGQRPALGLRWVNNDAVNLISNLLVTLAAVGGLWLSR